MDTIKCIGHVEASGLQSYLAAGWIEICTTYVGFNARIVHVVGWPHARACLLG